MLPFTILTIFTASALGAQLRLIRSASRNVRVQKSAPLIEVFPWQYVAERTGANPRDWLPAPTDFSEEAFSCTTTPGPDRLGCPLSIDGWSSVLDKDGNISLAAGECRAITQNCCQTVVCAPFSDLSVPPAEVTGRMWNPMTIKCVLNGEGAMWQSEGGKMYIQMERPATCNTNPLDLRSD